MLSFITPDSVSVIAPSIWASESKTLFDNLPDELRHIILHYDAGFRSLSTNPPTSGEMDEIINDKIFLEEDLFCSIPESSVFNEQVHPDRAYSRSYQDATGFGYDHLDYSRFHLALPDQPGWGENIRLMGVAAIASIVSARYNELGFTNPVAKGKEAALHALDAFWHRYHFLYPTITTKYLKLCVQELQIEVGDYLDINRLYKTVRAAI